MRGRVRAVCANVISEYCHGNRITNNVMSISVFSPTSRSSWRSHHPPAQDFYLSQSISHVQSAGGFSGLEASTLSAGFVQQVSLLNITRAV